ncbi:MAG: hypothetical protein Q9216_006416, partial [Gyalolechia sp. 2 TL-2023]
MRFTKPSAFFFSQKVRGQQSDDGGYTSLRPEGEIHIKVSDRPASEQSIWVENEIRAHDSPRVHIASSENGIDIISPPIAPIAQTTTDPSVYITSTIYISPNLPLLSFHLETSSFAINIPNGIPLRPRTPIHISAPSSNLNFFTSTSPSFLLIDARSTTLTTISGPITGDFHLRDSLSIHTTSSSININLSLLPSPSNRSSSSPTTTNTPATLDLQSSSGSIAVRTSTISTPAQIPNRDFRSTIRTNSGSVSASLVHNSSAVLRSDSGGISAEIYPHRGGSNNNTTARSDLSTRTLSGRTEVHVHPSLTTPLSPLRNFFAQHHAVSGRIRVSYPGQWEGRVEGVT